MPGGDVSECRLGLEAAESIHGKYVFLYRGRGLWWREGMMEGISVVTTMSAVTAMLSRRIEDEAQRTRFNVKGRSDGYSFLAGRGRYNTRGCSQ